MPNVKFQKALALAVIWLFIGLVLLQFIVWANILYSTVDHNDQQQPEATLAYCTIWPDILAQSFIPTLDRLTRVHLSVSKDNNPSDLVISIRSELDGNDLTSVTYPSQYIAQYPDKHLIDCNLPDITLIPGQTYYIIFQHKSERTSNDFLYWWYSPNAPYQRGTGWYWTDENGPQWIDAQIDFCFKTYGYNEGENQPPDNPKRPTGSTCCIVDTIYEYSTNTSDVDGDNIRYGWDWNADYIVDEWTDFYASGQLVYIDHLWETPGSYSVRVKAEDDKESKSLFSKSLEVTVLDMNHPPDIPNALYPNDDSYDIPINIELNWSCDDSDLCDELTYDVYFGETSPPPLVS